MRKSFTFLVTLFIIATTIAQSPQKMSYQAVIRNNSNTLVISTSIGMRVSVLQGSETGTEVYKEIYNPNPQTNANGLVSLEIGNGMPLNGIFASINWANGPYFIKVETDPTGGTNYSITGISQLLSVPYALYSANNQPGPQGPIGLTGPQGPVGAGMYLLNSLNYTNTVVAADNYVAIQGTISLAADYSGFSNNHLAINGGTVTGNGTYVLDVGNNCVFNGVTFNAVDIDCNWATFINCTFIGSCSRIGHDSKFYDCQFSGVTTGYNYILGSVVNSIVSNCTMPRCKEFVNSSLTSCTIGNGAVNQCAISYISGCNINTSSIYALQSDLFVTDNHFSNSSIFLNNSTQVCSSAIIANNRFESGLTSTTSPINIDPTTASYKIYNIHDNLFTMQATDDYCIKFTSSTNGASYTNVAIKGNTFWRGANTFPIYYQSSIVVDYTGNTVWQLSNPTSSGALTVSSPNFSH
ncbi:MAG: hypothetical protein ACYC25_00455 [Paludibacter sp.]